MISSETLIGLAGLILAVLTYFAGVQRTKRHLKAKEIHIKQEAIRDFGLFKTKLEDEINRPSLLHIGTAAQSFPVALAIKTLISNHPIDYWYRILNDEEFKSLPDRILDFRDQYRVCMMETLHLKLSAPYLYPTRAIFQQGLAATCKDLPTKGTT